MVFFRRKKQPTTTNPSAGQNLPAAPTPVSAPTPASAPAMKHYDQSRVQTYGATDTGLPPIFPRFQTIEPMPAATIAAYRGKIPDAIIEMWETYGQGFVSDGYLRMLDPAVISPDGIIDPDPGAVALFNTALDDTIYWHGQVNAFILISWRLGTIDLVSINNPQDPRANLISFGDPDFQFRALGARHFREWLARGGNVPSLTSGLYHAPVPCMGGYFSVTTLREGDALVSQQIYLDFSGRPRLRFEDPDIIRDVPDF